jgi:hypothetical protein
MDSGNLAWYIAATALVLFMTPGVAFFYGGLVKAKSVISMMMMSFGAMGLVAVLWILYGYNMQTADWWGGILGNPFSDFGLGAMATGENATVNLTAVAYGATFAIITVALISGAIADRALRLVDDLRVLLRDDRLLRRRRLGVEHQRLDLQPRHDAGLLDRGDRLRRWNRCPHQRRCGRPRSPWCSASASASRRASTSRTTCRS